MTDGGKETRQERPEGYTMPTVVRARSFYLYDRRGVRYTDFFRIMAEPFWGIDPNRSNGP